MFVRKEPRNCESVPVKQKDFICSDYARFSNVSCLPDEPISSENLNGHAAPSVTSEEVKVDIESPETQQGEQSSVQGDKTGTVNRSGPVIVRHYNIQG